MDFLQSLSESKLFPSQAAIERRRDVEIAEFTYYYLLALRIMRLEDHTETFAKRYAKRTAEWGGFDKWRSSATDLYLLLNRLHHIDHPDKGKAPFPINLDLVQRWLANEGRGQHSDAQARRLLTGLDFALKIKTTSAKALRRTVMNWDDQSVREKSIALTKLYNWFHNDAPRSDLIKDLKKLRDEYADKDEQIEEAADSPKSFLTYLQQRKD